MHDRGNETLFVEENETLFLEESGIACCSHPVKTVSFCGGS